MLQTTIEAGAVEPDALQEYKHSRLKHALNGGYAHLYLGLHLAQLLMRLLPDEFAGHVRAHIFRWAGFRIGAGTDLLGAPRLRGWGPITRRLTVGQKCSINVNCYMDLNDTITIGENVGIGPDVMILTSTHTIGPPHRRVGELERFPVVIGDGVWLGARAVVLPGVTIGAGAVISAGAVVARDVPPNTLFAGVPARLLQHL